MRYVDSPNEQRYHREGLWKPCRWNTGDTGKAPRYALGNPNWVFSTTKNDSVICANFQDNSWQFFNFQNSSTEKKVAKGYKHRWTLGTSLRYIISGANLVFSSKASYLAMCGNIQMISMRYDDFPNEQRYHREGLGKSCTWNLADTRKALRFALGNPNYVFSTMKNDSVICRKFQSNSWEFSKFQNSSIQKKVAKC